MIPRTIAQPARAPCVRPAPTMYTFSLSLHTPQPSHVLPPSNLEYLTFTVIAMHCAAPVHVIVIKVLRLHHVVQLLHYHHYFLHYQ